jgi:O-acetyl-ADP-ribose deacetylase (regulator of RNase III)
LGAASDAFTLRGALAWDIRSRLVDILLLQASVLRLPSSKRASAIVYDGSQDLGLWRPPGPDRDLLDAYGDDLRNVLDKEAKRLPSKRLQQGGIVRLHPGKLHCDFLIWVGSRPGHGDTEPAPAPSVEVVQDIARRVIEFAAECDVVRLAFPALGAGRGEAPAADRMSAIVRAAAAYKEACFAAERPAHIEEVIVCDPSSANVSKAKRTVERLARAGYAEPEPAAPVAAKAKERAPRAPRAAGTSRKASKITADEIATARARAAAYDRTRTYFEGSFFVHPTFGIGKVTLVKPDRMILVIFETGEERTMIHAR